MGSGARRITRSGDRSEAGELHAGSWIEVSAGALTHNVRVVRDQLKPDVLLMAVVKANAYGHGPAAAAVIETAGADMLAVTTVAEAAPLRQVGVVAPVLAFAPLLPEQFEAAVALHLTLTVASMDDARWLSEAAQKAVKIVPIHLKVDCGMGRFGVLPEDALPLARLASSLPGLRVEGVYTHFSVAMEPDLAGLRMQFHRFQEVLAQLDEAGLRPPLAHCANSAALLQLPETQLDLVRVGTLLYGQYPAAFLAARIPLQPTWRFKARVISVKNVPAGWSVGYGAEFVTQRPSRLAVLPVGFADGFAVEVNVRSTGRAGLALKGLATRAMKSTAKSLRELLGRSPGRAVKFEGRSIPIIGRVGMQTLTLDVTEFPEVEVGTVVEVPARRVTSNPLIPRRVVED